jgi:hypothetical protein
MRRIVLASTCLTLIVAGPAALAQSLELAIPINTVAHASGVLATEPVPAALQGATCQVSATAQNQSSVHPNSNLIVTSGSDSITLLDVEREPGAVTTTDESLTLGSDITVTLEIGPDGIFSGGMTLLASCQPSSPTPTETETPTPTVTPTETPSPTPSESPSGTVTHTSTPTDGPPTVEPSTVTPPGTGGLAFTGPGAMWSLLLGSVALLVTGFGLLRAGYKRRRGL